MCVFESLTGYTDDGGYENRNAYILIIIKSKAMQTYVGYFKQYFATSTKQRIALICILVLVVIMLTRICEFTQKYGSDNRFY